MNTECNKVTMESGRRKLPKYNPTIEHFYRNNTAIKYDFAHHRGQFTQQNCVLENTANQTKQKQT